MRAEAKSRDLKQRLCRLVAHPATRDLDLDDPCTTETRRCIIKQKGFLHCLYRDFYAELLAAKDRAPMGPVLELGSGGGFIKEMYPPVLTSEVFFCRGLDLVSDGTRMPFGDSSLAAILMLDVLHHIPRPLDFLGEASRCLMPGGRLAMIEPMNTAFSRLVYRHLHHEPFDPKAGWDLEAGGPLSQANQAMAWILFFRDLKEVMARLPRLELVGRRLHSPVAYLLSGGLSLRLCPPRWTFNLVRKAEKALSPFNTHLAMFVTLELAKTEPVS